MVLILCNIISLITSSVVFSVTAINISYSCLQVNDIYLLRLLNSRAENITKYLNDKEKVTSYLVMTITKFFLHL